MTREGNVTLSSQEGKVGKGNDGIGSSFKACQVTRAWSRLLSHGARPVLRDRIRWWNSFAPPIYAADQDSSNASPSITASGHNAYFSNNNVFIRV